jgi:hypothetical protein
MIKNLLKKVLGFAEEKFLKFLECVFSGKTGEFLEENHKIINEVVDQVEEIAKMVADEGIEKTINYVELKLGINVKNEIIEIKAEGITKSNAKKKLAQKIIYNNLMKLEKNVVWHAINVGIELAVSKLNK